MMCGVHTTANQSPQRSEDIGISHDHDDLTETHGDGGHAGNFAQ